MAAIFAIAALGPARMTSVAWADEDPPEEETVTSVTIDVLGWEFTPVIQNGIIKGFFGQITPDIAVEGNLETVWFEQDENGDWVSSSWSGSGTAPNALGWIRGHFADLAIFGETPNLLAQAPESIFDEETQVWDDNWLAPTMLDGGLLEDDPLQLLLGDGPRTPEMFEMMAYNGWPVAPELSPLCSHHAGNCEGGGEETTLQQLINGLADTTQTLMPGTTIVGEMDPSYVVSLFNPWCPCIKIQLGRIPGSCSTWVSTDIHTPFGTKWKRQCSFAWRWVGEEGLQCTDCAKRSSDPGQHPDTGVWEETESVNQPVW